MLIIVLFGLKIQIFGGPIIGILELLFKLRNLFLEGFMLLMFMELKVAAMVVLMLDFREDNLVNGELSLFKMSNYHYKQKLE